MSPIPRHWMCERVSRSSAILILRGSEVLSWRYWRLHGRTPRRPLHGIVHDDFAAENLAVANLDATIIAQAPRLGPYLAKMEGVIADVLGVEQARVNVKVTSTDQLGAIGRGEGIAASAVVLLEQA